MPRGFSFESGAGIQDIRRCANSTAVRPGYGGMPTNIAAQRRGPSPGSGAGLRRTDGLVPSAEKRL